MMQQELLLKLLSDDLGADSLDLFELVMALESGYNIEIPAEDLTDLTTVGAGYGLSLKNKGVEELNHIEMTNNFIDRDSFGRIFDIII